MVLLRQVLPPLLEQGRFGEQFIGLFLFGSLLLVLDLCFLLWLLFDWRFSFLCSFSLSVSVLYEQFLDGILLFLKSFEYGVLSKDDGERAK